MVINEEAINSILNTLKANKEKEKSCNGNCGKCNKLMECIKN